MQQNHDETKRSAAARVKEHFILEVRWRQDGLHGNEEVCRSGALPRASLALPFRPVVLRVMLARPTRRRCPSHLPLNRPGARCWNLCVVGHFWEQGSLYEMARIA